MRSHSDTVVDVRELVGHPGATRALDARMPAPADLSDDLVDIGTEATVHVMIESVVDGLLVRGTVRAPARVACARCLVERDETLGSDVVELFTAPDHADSSADPGSAEHAADRLGRAEDSTIEAGYDIVDDRIDLDTLLRDALAAAMPVRPLCRPDCAGLCPTCGADRNVAPCDGHPEQHDQRWAALADLQLPDAR